MRKFLWHFIPRLVFFVSLLAMWIWLWSDVSFSPLPATVYFLGCMAIGWYSDKLYQRVLNKLYALVS